MQILRMRNCSNEVLVLVDTEDGSDKVVLEPGV